jgi:hypothetical protein
MAFGSKTKTTVLLMTSIPSLAFGTDGKLNLDAAAKFLIAAALPSTLITAAPTNVPPVPGVAVTRGVNAALIPHFSYDSRETSATEYRSKFSLLVPKNLRLATMLGSEIAGIEGLSGSTAVPNLLPSGTNYAGPITLLERLVYSLAKDHGATITQIIVGGSSYLKITCDQVVTISGGGGG